MKENERFISQRRASLARPLGKTVSPSEPFADLWLKPTKNMKSSPQNGKDQETIEGFPKQGHNKRQSFMDSASMTTSLGGSQAFAGR